MQDLIVFSDHKIPVGIPIISTSLEQFQPLKIPSLIQIANKITHRIKCIVSILTHFQWQKVTIFYSIDRSSVDSSASAHRLFDSLRLANVEIKHRLDLSSSSQTLIEQELKKLMKSQRNRVFIVTQLSLELVVLLLNKAKKLNMVGNGYVWIVSDDVFDLVDSLDSSFWYQMESVIGFRAYIDDTKKSSKIFDTKFKKRYNLEYPKEEEPAKASIFAIRAYDAAWAITRAMKTLGENLLTSDKLLKEIIESNFEGLSGTVRFKNGRMLVSQSPEFEIIQVMDQSYKEVAFWTPKLGFVERSNKPTTKLLNPKVGNVAADDQNPNGQKRLKIWVPGQGACQEFVKVNKHLNGKNYISGFSIDVFRAAMNNLNMSYDLFPFDGTYDNMIEAIDNKVTKLFVLSFNSKV